ncbi:hypothetical protein QA612_03250 [Evansella sp. AB-P1]|uniref:hypothetical protein n=1 Tax=Evansella sp. AB-P1 TaxID=3037653 RepID=UPI00241BECE5|nr:hypothetical protein [Evansella sp. AB-P1]MDG5786493.1 hypothetical protein [Evansella sp. AB-P1]
MALDETTEKDIVKEINGLTVAFDEMIHEQTEGLTLELKVTPEGKGLTITGNESDCC